MTPGSGKVGTRVTLFIPSVTSKMMGHYQIVWSSTSSFDKNDTIVLNQGIITEKYTAITTHFTIPEASYGLHFIRFIAESSSIPITLKFNVSPGLAVSPKSTEQGSTVSLVGTGFPPTNVVAITLGSKRLDSYITTDELGSFQYKLVVPDVSASEYKLTATTEYVIVTTTSELEIVPAADNSDKTLEEAQTRPPISDATEENNRNEPVTDYKSPSKPFPTTPVGQRTNLIGGQEVTFKWSEVSDTSGILYTVEINDTPDFSLSEPLIQKSGLRDNTYTLHMEPGTYYWRVQAIDGAGNESGWTNAPYAFKVGELSVFINEFVDFLNKTKIFLILIYTAGGIFVFRILVLIVRALVRRHREYY